MEQSFPIVLGSLSESASDGYADIGTECIVLVTLECKAAGWT